LVVSAVANQVALAVAHWIALAVANWIALAFTNRVAGAVAPPDALILSGLSFMTSLGSIVL